MTVIGFSTLFLASFSIAQYSCATAVPTQAVFNGYALGTYAGWNGCGCNNSLWG